MIVNVQKKPNQTVNGMDNGAIIRPIVYRKLAAAKYCPRICSGANFEIKLCYKPTIINSPNVKIAIAKRKTQNKSNNENTIIAIAYKIDEMKKTFFSLKDATNRVTATVSKATRSPFSEIRTLNASSPVSFNSLPNQVPSDCCPMTSLT